MDKIIVFTDIHILREGGQIIGLDPAERFAQGLAHAAEHHPDAASIVICGDLTHHGTSEEYSHLRHILADCPVPVSLMIGNHDRREAFYEAFPGAPKTASGHLQHVIDLSDTRLVLLDTLDEDAPDLHSGLLCAERLSWMDEALRTAGERRVIVFSHHPPMLTGFDGMDSIGLRNRDELIARVSDHGNVVQFIAGHVHRTISGGAGGVPVAIFKGTCHQMPMQLGDPSHSVSVDEPPAYGILLLGTDGVIVHSEDYNLPFAEIDHTEAAARLGT